MRPRSLGRVSAGLVPAILVLVSGSAFAADLASPLRSTTERRLAPVHALKVDEASLTLLRDMPTARLLAFPLADGREVSVSITRVEVFAPGARVVVATRAGEVPLDLSSMLLFSGTIDDAPGSRVFLSFSPAGINGFVLVDDQTQIISSGPMGSRTPVIFNVERLPEGMIRWMDKTCGTMALPAPNAPILNHNPGGPAPVSSPCRVADLAIETDWEYTRDIFGGNTTVAAAYAATLIAADSEIYTRDINTRLRVSFLRVWGDDSDPYSTSGTLNRLFEFQDFWNANMTGTARDAAHILSGVRGEYGGVAYLPGLCNQTYDYGLSTYLNGSFPYPLQDNNPQNWDVFVTAHEIGHNFGAPHSHDLVPPIDGCGLGNCNDAPLGSIMSYCHGCSGGVGNIALTLQQRMIDERILPYLNSVSCDLSWAGAEFTSQPADVSTGPGGTAVFTATAVGDPGLSLRWHRDGTPLNDGDGISGTDTATLTINPVRAALAGEYTLVVTTTCGEVSSNAATLTFCAADYNLDGTVDFFDYLDFVADFSNEAPKADVNGDNTVDFFDYLDYVAAFDAGCA
jgi:hypothetical protein